MIISKKLLGQKLRDMYDFTDNKALIVHLFGIKYAEIIRANGYNAREIIETAGLGYGYQSELQKGMKLAKYVEIKNNMDKFEL